MFIKKLPFVDSVDIKYPSKSSPQMVWNDLTLAKILCNSTPSALPTNRTCQNCQRAMRKKRDEKNTSVKFSHSPTHSHPATELNGKRRKAVRDSVGKLQKRPENEVQQKLEKLTPPYI